MTHILSHAVSNTGHGVCVGTIDGFKGSISFNPCVKVVLRFVGIVLPSYVYVAAKYRIKSN